MPTTAAHSKKAPHHKPHAQKHAVAHVVIPPDVIAAAQAAQATYGVPSSVTLAQWAQESGYGHHMPSHSNNPFGIKAAEGQDAVNATTREEHKKGKSTYLSQPFRKFATINDAFVEHGRLLATNPAYATARSFLSDPDKFADALTGTYATDHAYGHKLKNLMKTQNLYQYDHPAAAPPAPPATAAAPTP